MLQPPLSLLLIISFLMLTIFSVSIANSNIYIYVQCSQLNFTTTTPYESNVNSLFTSLAYSASSYHFNTFETSPQNDGVYGLFQCRGDLSSANCKDCVANAISQLKPNCPQSTGGQIQLEGCFVKYDDTSFFGVQEKTEVCKRCGPSNGYNSDVSNRIDGALGYLVDGNGQYFREGNFGSIQGLAQCVQDLSSSDCEDCLSEASGRLRTECETSTSADMYLGKCYIRYADQGNEILGSNTNSSSNSNQSSGGNKHSVIATWITAVASVITAIAGCGVTCYFTNYCNLYVTVNKYKTAKEEAKIAKENERSAKTAEKKAVERAEKAEKKAEEKKREPIGYCPHGQMQMLMPPPCPYGHSNPNSCYY